VHERFVQCDKGSKKTKSRSWAGPKKFAEPVSLSSTASADLPLAGTAFGLGFDLLALRARRKQDTSVCVNAVKRAKQDVAAICGNFFFQHFHSQSSNLWVSMWKRKASAHVTGGRRRTRDGQALADDNASGILVP
jgi:hypothetical protein